MLLSSKDEAEIEALISQERWGEVVTRCTDVLEERSDCNQAWHWLGIAQSHRGNREEALVAFDEAVRRAPGDGLLLYNRGTYLSELGRIGEAMETFSRAVELEPDYAPLRCNYGALLTQVGESEKAITQLEYAVRLKPEYPEAYNNAGNALRDQGRIDEALGMYREAIRLRPGYGVAYSNLLLCMCYNSRFVPERVVAEHTRWGIHFGTKRELPLTPRERGPRIRVGYVSSDFRAHSVAFFIESVLRHHDRSRFEIFAYSDVEREDAVTSRLKGHVEHWRSIVGMPHREVARAVREDGVDVLVDLGGHTANNRLETFALRAAPVQITYLGYPNTTGLPQMDYRFVDEWTDPEENAGFCREALLYLEPGFIVYDPPSDVADPGPSPHLESGKITFGSFNIVPKLNPPLIRVWAEILKQVEGSEILLKAKHFADLRTGQRYRELFEYYGVEADRVHIVPFAASYQEHMSTYHRVDIALDPYPYNGTTTTCEALWMGVPTLTMTGRCHSSRVGTSINSRVELYGFISVDEKSYIKKAVEWAGRQEDLVELRGELRERTRESLLCDGAGLTRSMEARFEQVVADCALLRDAAPR